MTIKKTFIIGASGIIIIFFLKYCFIWFAPLLFASIIAKIMNKIAHIIQPYLPLFIPFLPLLLYVFFLIFFFYFIFSLSFSLIQVIRVFIQTDFFTQLLTTLQAMSLPPFLYSSVETVIHRLISFFHHCFYFFHNYLHFYP